MANNTIMCGRCGHVFDHNPKFSIHCKCHGCGVSISIPDSRRYYLVSQQQTAQAPRPGLVAPPTNAQRRDPDAGLPPVVRDAQGAPMKPAAPPPHARTPDKPHYVADDGSFIRRRMEQLEKERQERIANAPLDEEGRG